MDPAGGHDHPVAGEIHDLGKTVKEGPAKKQILRRSKNTSFLPSSSCFEWE
jgi:hypothetical protein